MKKLLIVTFLLTGIAFHNCELCDPPDPLPYFDVKGLNMTHFTQDGFISKPIKANQSLSFSEYYGIKLDLLLDYLAYQKSAHKFDFSITPVLNACSPHNPGYKGAKSEKIESIKVTTVFPYDSSHLAGAEINDLLIVENGRIFLDSFIQKNLNHLIAHSEIYLELIKYPDPFIIWKGNFQLKTKIVLSNGEQYETVSDTIRFL